MACGKDGENLIGCQFLQQFGAPYNAKFEGKVIAHLSCTNELPQCRRVGCRTAHNNKYVVEFLDGTQNVYTRKKLHALQLYEPNVKQAFTVPSERALPKECEYCYETFLSEHNESSRNT